MEISHHPRTENQPTNRPTLRTACPGSSTGPTPHHTTRSIHIPLHHMAPRPGGRPLKPPRPLPTPRTLLPAGTPTPPIPGSRCRQRMAGTQALELTVISGHQPIPLGTSQTDFLHLLADHQACLVHSQHDSSQANKAQNTTTHSEGLPSHQTCSPQTLPLTSGTSLTPSTTTNTQDRSRP
jgi:hypothetical protein